MSVKNQHARKRNDSFFVNNILFKMDTFNSDYPFPSESAFRYQGKHYKGDGTEGGVTIIYKNGKWYFKKDFNNISFKATPKA
jgi:hypothetical protein